jgi:hypothetical protein
MRPIDGYSLELQSDSKVSIREPLTVNNARKGSQIADERSDHQPFIQFSSVLRQNSYSERAHVLRRRPFVRARILKTGYLDLDSQPDPFFKSS